MIEYGYINEDGYLVSKILEERTERRINEEGEPEDIVLTIQDQVNELINAGWKPVDSIDETKLTAKLEFGSVRLQPYDNGERISYNYIEEVSRNIIITEINKYKEQLANTDYKITKCYEASLLQKPEPYEINEIIEVRQQHRNRINELERLLK